MNSVVSKTGLNNIAPGSKILCAVSGGADSVYLLHRLSELTERGVISLGCAHFNHQLRGAESDRDARFCADTAKKLGVPFYIGAADVKSYAREYRLGIEEAARKHRYEFLLHTAEKYGYDRIATAHTANDNLETMLLNLCRGGGGAGLSGIPPERGAVLRPILDVTREEVEAWLSERGIKYIEDSSNLSDEYARNRLRHHVLPVLCGINSGCVKNAERAARLLRLDDELLSSMAADFLAANLEKRSDGSSRLPCPALYAQPFPVASRAVRQAAGRRLTMAQAESIMSLCDPGRGRARFSAQGLTVCREGEELVFSPPERAYFSPSELAIGRTILLEPLKIKVSAEQIDKCPEINNSFNIFYFQYEAVCGKMLVRSRQPGDKLRQSGRGVTKSLRRVFQEARIAPWEREGIPVLADDNGPLAVPGFKPRESAEALPGGRAIKVEFTHYD